MEYNLEHILHLSHTKIHFNFHSVKSTLLLNDFFLFLFMNLPLFLHSDPTSKTDVWEWSSQNFLFYDVTDYITECNQMEGLLF